MTSFSGMYADRLFAYVALKRAVGFQFERQVAHLHAFDEYVLQRGLCAPLSQEMVIAFATHDPSSSLNLRARRYQVVRGFCEYLATLDPRTPLLDPKALPRPSSRPVRHIISDEGLARLLREAQEVSKRHPVCGITLHTIVGLAASTGVRIGEVIRLDRADVDLSTGVLLIRQTKFRKDRYVPIHPSTLEAMRSYAALRDATFPDCRDAAFFVTMRQRRFVRNTLQQAVCKIARRAGLRGPQGAGISFHSLRHRFAVKRLIAWYKAGVDVQAMLPMLATYMGHVCYSETAYYLTATPELLGLAAERCERALQGEQP
jgi:integrase